MAAQGRHRGLPLQQNATSFNAFVLGPVLPPIETARTMREDLDTRDESLLQQKTYIFERTIDKVREIAASMGASRVYAERFSNTRWVRQELDSVSKIFLSINEIIKIDELEDVFELARKICKGENGEGPGEIFMELQMKNAFLLPGSITDDVKEFAIVEVSSDEGIPINRVVKV